MRRGLLGLILMSCWMPVWGAIAISLDAATVSLGQPVRVTLTYNPSEVRGTPDLTALQTDFVILATEQNMSYTVINGQAQATGQWNIVLQPNRTGILLIPSITIGSQSSPPTQVTVNPTAKTQPATQQSTQTQPNVAPASDNEAAKLTAAVNNPSPYLHQEVLYTVKLISRQPLMNVHYRHPHVNDAILFPLGEGRQYQTTLSGVLYNVDEQTYAIFPQKSGEMTITPPSIQAVAYGVMPEHVSLHAETLTIHIRPLPKHQSLKNWLPSKLVRLRETYDQTETNLTQGTTLVRTVTLQAQGLVAKLLPQLSLDKGAGFSLYASKPDILNDLKQGELWGSTKQAISYVFTQPGLVHLPAITVPWFNIKNQRIEMATLPARDFNIIAKKATVPNKAIPAKRKELFAKHFSLGHWATRYGYEIIPVGIAVVISITMVIWLYRKRKNTPNPWQLLRDACHRNDPIQAKMALLLWAKQKWPQASILELSDIGKQIDNTPLQHQVSLLIAALYHPDPTAWQGEALWRAIRGLTQPKSRPTKHTSFLPPINPKRGTS